MGYFDGISFSEFREAFTGADRSACLNALFGFVSRHRGPLLAALRQAEEDYREYQARAAFLARKARVSLARLERTG